MRASSKKPTNKLPEQRLLVLVVDDSVDTRDMYAEYLTFSGLQTIVAADGLEALRKAEDELPDVIALDMSLPLLDGWEVTRRLKVNPKTHHICIIALTGRADPKSVAKANDAGCDVFIAKPGLPEQLLRAVLSCKTKKPLEQRPSRQP